MPKPPLYLALVLIAAAAPPPGVPDDLQALAREHFRDIFVLPDTAIWTFEYTKPYPLGGTTVCGRVNYMDASRKYVGDNRFYAIIQDGQVIDGSVLSKNALLLDPSGKALETYQRFCEDA